MCIIHVPYKYIRHLELQIILACVQVHQILYIYIKNVYVRVVTLLHAFKV